MSKVEIISFEVVSGTDKCSGSFLVDGVEVTSKLISHHIWLRDHCHCTSCYHGVTRQRLQNSCEIPRNIAPISISVENDFITITWTDGHEGEYQILWLVSHSYFPKIELRNPKQLTLPRTLWNVAKIKAELPTVDYNSVIESEKGVAEWCSKIWEYGFCLVENVPVSPEVTEKLIERIAFIRPTHYGGFWDFTADLKVNDTAYTDIAIPLHTDGTYFTDPPGLQLFHLLKHTGTGGVTTLCDSFQAAKFLREKYPESYDTLSRVLVPAHSAGEDSTFIQPSYPRPILCHDNKGELIQVRWNISDRSTLQFDDPEDVPRFYEAIGHWNEIIESEKNEFYHTLKPGQCLIFDNWRVFHSRRNKFTGERRMCGGYINHDDFVSRLKLSNLERADLLDTL
ncbi:unnamed protein product [Kuraishia capsulata CBS 1993]|uniref:Trimethyllysine dioxygenase n=1 Tax=Kuraishia capsulata CBS 1993 TaxID=1382522 RepID=W6MN32_9ASCO|nr:uncharacterized protein KUCA_T00002414001 [Kuraishia capsulata CBS 1993]CDK26442.1 unnamed protein product [Kuraishia capsulata CBS 1993]